MLVFFWIASASLALTLLADLCVFVHLRRRNARSARGALPAISVLKPLKGVDGGLYENLTSFARQRYPEYQLVFGAEDPNDPALQVARRVQRENLDVDIVVVAGAQPFGLNPKVRNLASLSKSARHPYWLISDSNVCVRPEYLAETASELSAPQVGMVTNLFAGTGGDEVGSVLENLHLNTFVAGGIAAAQVLSGNACVVGKSMLFSRAQFETMGGWASIGDILAEDYILGRRFAAAGKKVLTSRHVIFTRNSGWGFGRFLNRHVRWGQIRRRGQPLCFLGEPLINPVLWALLLALTGTPLAALAFTAAKIAADALTARRLSGRWPSALQIALLPGKDLLVAALWFVAAFKRKVTWRGNVLRIGSGTRLSAPEGAGARRTRIEKSRPVPAGAPTS